MSGQHQPRGIVLIHKPRGMTSFGVVSRLRKLIGMRRIGHCGTLDPFAEGLLPVCIGRATAAIQFMDKYDKTYLVKVMFGQATDTMDTEGQKIAGHTFSRQELEDLETDNFTALRQAVLEMIGIQQQTPPMYSAVKIAGKPLYSYAREGKTVERKSRQITVYNAELIKAECNQQDMSLSAYIRISCSKGTYIRVLADELGRRLGYYAYASELIREQCGPYTLDKAVDIEMLFSQSRELNNQSDLVKLMQKQGVLLPIASAFTEYPNISLDYEQAEKIINGVTIAVDEMAVKHIPSGYNGVLALFYKHELIAAARIILDEYNSKQIKTERVFVDIEAFRSL